MTPNSTAIATSTQPRHVTTTGLPHASRAASQSVDGPSDSSDSYATVARLVSSTAHDLRAPLSTIREAVRMVRDGEMGRLSTDQMQCLSAAIDQCNCASEMVDEMAQTREFETGFPNVHREWMSLGDLRHQIESTLQPWVLPRGIHLLWDGPFGGNQKIYGDRSLMRRLIVNLASNAIRVTREGGHVLIRASVSRPQNTVAWSVVDQGNGITPPDMDLIAAGKAPVRSDGGLGLMISRQLAAAHFSTLRIESRQGTGTAVSFTTPTGGPAAVVRQWAEFRRRQIARVENGSFATTSVPRRSAPSEVRIRARNAIQVPRRVRIDVPARVVELSAGGWSPAFPSHMYVTSVTVGAAIPAATANAFDALLQKSLRISEFSYRTGRRTWTLVWDADGAAGSEKQAEFERRVQSELDSVRMTWGRPCLMCDVDDQRPNQLTSRLCDMVVRRSLYASQQSIPDADQVRPGAGAIGHSIEASERLTREIAWLKRRVK